jgi:hypothetical protein
VALRKFNNHHGVATLAFSMLAMSLFSFNTTHSFATDLPVSLSIKIESGTGAVSSWRLRCNPNGGNHPAVKKSCKLLNSSEGKKILFPVTKDACSQVYGGSAKATIKGTYGKKKVSLNLSRENGCKISEWERVFTLLGTR